MTRKRSKALNLLVFSGVAGILAATFAADIIVPLGRNIWLAYFLALVLSFTSRHIWLPLVTGPVILVLLVIGVVAGAGTTDPSLAILNRSMAGVVILILTLSGALMIRNRLQLTAHDWEQRAEVRIAQELQGDLSVEEIGQRSLDVICEVLGVRAAALYDLQGQQLVRIASWGMGKNEAPADGEGHLWRAVRGGKPVHLCAPGEHALPWSSGLLQGQTAHSFIVPTREGNRVNGVIEIGSDTPPDERAVRFLEEAGNKVGVELRSADYRKKLQELLEQTRVQAAELYTHSEKLAATNVELEEQARALKESETRLRDQQAELEEQNAQLETQTRQLEEQRDALTQTSRIMAEQAEQLARESRYKSEFVANMSHELRTPLNALLIMARLLSENRPGNLSQEQVQWAEAIQSSGKDLLTLINDILDLSRIEAGKIDITSEPVAPDDILKRMHRYFAPQAAERGLALAIECPDAPPVISTDANRLEQILRNFISNALKFTAQGSITLRFVREGDGEVAFQVSDTGIGIAPEQHEAVFEAFRQADGSISRRFGGTGLGLSISRDLAELLGGRISLESTPGAGSTFILHLPTHLVMKAQNSGGSHLQKARDEMARYTGKGSIQPRTVERPLGQLSGVKDDRDALGPEDRALLIVEDDASFATLLLDLAHELGLRAIVVGTADEAILAAHHYDLQGVVLDVGLPDHSGLTVLDRLKRDPQTRHIPVHIVSGMDYTREALAQGAVSYLLKPVTKEALVRTLDGIGEMLDKSPRHLLIVEDDPAQLDGLRALLGSDNVQTRGASTTAEAIAACRETTFDCIVLDMTLPDGSGFDLLEKLSEDETVSFPPVIVYTARALTDAEEQQLRRYSQSIIIKGAKSLERLIDEVTLFLHQVVSDLSERQREMLTAALNRDAQLEGRRILVVEDDIRNIYALSGVFEPHGVEVQIARNGYEALAALARCAEGSAPKIDLVLMDVMMPEMDGLTATREIRKIGCWKNLPIIMLTAKAMADDQAQCLAAGANDYLSKPLDVDKLLSLTRVWMPR